MGLEGIFSLLLTFALIAEFVNSVALIIGIISLWILFNKAGEKGWKALIPIYNIYILCKITGVWKGYVFVFLCIPVVLFFAGLIDSMIFAIIGADIEAVDNTPILTLTSLFFILFALEYNITQSISLAKSYGKSWIYGLCIMGLPVIFVAILALGSSAYVGPRPFALVMGKNKDNNEESDNQPSDVSVDQPVLQQDSNQLINEETKSVDSDSPRSNIVPGIICKQCGEKNAIDSKYCVKCGNDL